MSEIIFEMFNKKKCLIKEIFFSNLITTLSTTKECTYLCICASFMHSYVSSIFISTIFPNRLQNFESNNIAICV